MNEMSRNYYSDEFATFGDRVAAARRSQGLSQKDLASKLGVTLASVTAWESDRNQPRANKMQMLAAILNVSLRWLLSGEVEDANEGIFGPAEDVDSEQCVESILAEVRELKGELVSTTQKLSRLENRLRSAL